MKTIRSFDGLKVYFIGIGGISMSGLALMLKSLGSEVEGSDTSSNSEIIEKLRQSSIRVNVGHIASNIYQDIDLVVYTSAIKDNNPELCRARDLHIMTMERAELLGLLSKSYVNVIAISGTHGKTTTTSMIGEIFTYAGLNPTIHIGGVSVNLGSNTIVGGRDYLILEACEYCNSFRFIPSTTAVITNIEADHLDYYKDLSEIYTTFEYFASRSSNLIKGQEVGIQHSACESIGKDWVAGDVVFENNGYSYLVYYKGNLWGKVKLNLLGRHNVINSLYAIAVATKYGIGRRNIIEALANFKGVERRNETIAKVGNAPVIIDYAHHPTELRASIEAYNEVCQNALVVFQPHTYSRTISLFDDFIDVLRGVEDLIIYPTYPAREEEIIGGRAIDLLKGLGRARYVDSIENLVQIISDTLTNGYADMCLVLGAGDLADKLKAYYRTREH